MSGFAAAMVLAAGRGERMRPLSDVLPKPALPLPEGPVVASAMRLAATAGARRIVVNTWHLGALMAAAVAEVALPGVEILLSPEPSLMGTAGGLALARDRGLLDGEGPILVLNGDGVLDLELAPLAARHAASGDLVTLALRPHPDSQRWSRVLLAADGRVEAMLAAGPAAPEENAMLYPGVMVVAREALARLPAGRGEIAPLLWGPALAAGRLGGVVVPGSWREVGTPADYRELVVERLGDAAWVHPSASVAPSAVLRGSLVGAGSRVAEEAVVHGSVVAAGAQVGAGAEVTGSVLLGRVAAAPDEKLDGVLRAQGPPAC